MSLFIVLYVYECGKSGIASVTGSEKDVTRNIYFIMLLITSSAHIAFNIKLFYKIEFKQKIPVAFFIFFSFYNIFLTVFHSILRSDSDVLIFNLGRQISFPLILLSFFIISYESVNFKKYIKIIILGAFLSFLYSNLTIKYSIEESVFRTPAAMFLVLLFPSTFILSKNIIIEMFFISILLLVSLLSLNRGIVLSVSIFCVIYSFMRFKNIFTKFLILILFIVVFYFLASSDLGDSLMNRFKSIYYDDGSGRLRIWPLYINFISEGGIFNFLLGYGYRNLSHIAGITSHNDFINFMLYFGLFSFLMYLCIYVYLIKFILSKHFSFQIRIYSVYFFVILVINSFLINLFDNYSHFLAISIGVLLGVSGKYYKTYKNSNDPSY